MIQDVVIMKRKLSLMRYPEEFELSIYKLDENVVFLSVILVCSIRIDYKHYVGLGASMEVTNNNIKYPPLMVEWQWNTCYMLCLNDSKRIKLSIFILLELPSNAWHWNCFIPIYLFDSDVVVFIRLSILYNSTCLLCQ